MKSLLIFIIAAIIGLAACTPVISGDKQSGAPPPAVAFSYEYYTYGGPPEAGKHEAEQSVLARYGISPHNFGCVVTDSILTAVKTHNDSLFRLLQPKFPGISEERIQSEIAAVRAALIKKS